jgi:hypothetical protein
MTRLTPPMVIQMKTRRALPIRARVAEFSHGLRRRVSPPTSKSTVPLPSRHPKVPLLVGRKTNIFLLVACRCLAIPQRRGIAAAPSPRFALIGWLRVIRWTFMSLQKVVPNLLPQHDMVFVMVVSQHASRTFCLPGNHTW